eukprot:339302-Hanusia_phi.AAC.1
MAMEGGMPLGGFSQEQVTPRVTGVIPLADIRGKIRPGTGISDSGAEPGPARHRTVCRIVPESFSNHSTCHRLDATVTNRRFPAHPGPGPGPPPGH